MSALAAILIGLLRLALQILSFLYRIFYLTWRVLLLAFARLKVWQQPPTKHAKVVIIGGGFTGALTAKLLEYWFDVTLIDAKTYFEFTPSILRALVLPKHSQTIQRPHSSYLHRARYIHDVATAIGPDYVATASNQDIPFDYLLVCTGAQYSSLPGSQGSSGDGALVLSSRLSNLAAHHAELVKAKTVLVIGAGTVGVELSAEIIEQFPKKEVILVGPILPRAPPRARRHAELWLRTHGITLMPTARVQRHEGRMFYTSDGDSVQADIAFLSTGNIPNSTLLQRSKELSQYINERGYAVVNEFLQLGRFSKIFVAGDVTYVPGEDEKLCQDAIASARVVAENIYKLHYTPSKALCRYMPCKRPMVISLGQYDGIFTYYGWTLTGFIPACLKEGIEWKEMLGFQQLWRPPTVVHSHSI